MTKHALVLLAGSVIFAGCTVPFSANPSWSGSREEAVEAPAATVPPEPVQTLEQVDQAVSTDLDMQVDKDLDQIDQDLRNLQNEATF